jgi:S-formylglutathione hydrolase
MRTQLAANRCFGGEQLQFSHSSVQTGGTMTFSVYLPLGPGPFPVLIWLSGLSCTDQNFVTKAGSQRIAAELGMAIVAPDTSPRGARSARRSRWFLGFRAGGGLLCGCDRGPLGHPLSDVQLHPRRAACGFRWLAPGSFADFAERSLHGRAWSADPGAEEPGPLPLGVGLCAHLRPLGSPRGHKAFGRYLGPDQDRWKDWDATALIATAPERPPILVDQGLADGFLEKQLRPERLEAACAAAGHPLQLRRREGYDHSYYFVASFLEEHLRWHAAALTN